jgi:hypothetical protein
MSLRFLTIPLALTLLAGCGGGGGDDGGDPDPGPGTNVQVSLTGRVTYDFPAHTGLGAINYNSMSQRPVRGARVELHSGSSSAACGSSGTLLLTATTTNASGDYAIAGTIATGSVVVCVYAELKQTGGGATPGWEFLVVDNTASKALYALASSTINVTAALTSTVNIHAPSGWGGSSYTGTRSAAPFAILDVAYTVLQKILAVDADVQLPRLRLNWSINNRNTSGDLTTGNIGTSFFTVESGSREIYILGEANDDTDEFDDHVVAHEIGHYIEDALSRADSLGGSHGGDDRLDLRVAYGEGFGNAWSGIVFDDPLYQDSFGNQQASGFAIDVENDTSPTAGWYNETSTQSLIYDAYDSTNEAGDTVALGLGPLYAVWTGAQRTTPAMTSIFPFLKALRDQNASAVAGINALATAQSISGTDEWGTGETNSGGATVLPVYVDYTVGSGATQVCTTNANGEYNKLGNRRFLRFTVASTANRTFAVSGPAGSDPDAVLFLAGAEVRRSEAVGNESFQQSLAAGTYVLEVYDFDNVDQSGGTGGNTCLQVTIS